MYVYRSNKMDVKKEVDEVSAVFFKHLTEVFIIRNLFRT